jgi:hypothetical protein
VGLWVADITGNGIRSTFGGAVRMVRRLETADSRKFVKRGKMKSHAKLQIPLRKKICGRFAGNLGVFSYA